MPWSLKGAPEAPNTIPLSRPNSHSPQWGLNAPTDFGRLAPGAPASRTPTGARRCPGCGARGAGRGAHELALWCTDPALRVLASGESRPVARKESSVSVNFLPLSALKIDRLTFGRRVGGIAHC